MTTIWLLQTALCSPVKVSTVMSFATTGSHLDPYLQTCPMSFASPDTLLYSSMHVEIVSKSTKTTHSLGPLSNAWHNLRQSAWTEASLSSLILLIAWIWVKTNCGTTWQRRMQGLVHPIWSPDCLHLMVCIALLVLVVRACFPRTSLCRLDTCFLANPLALSWYLQAAPRNNETMQVHVKNQQCTEAPQKTCKGC